MNSFRNENGQGYCSIPVDLIKDALDIQITIMDSVFDFEAGLTDVYQRAGVDRPTITDGE